MPESEQLESRIRRCLDRIGYESVSAVHQGSGKVLLQGEVPLPLDCSIAFAAVRCVAGVTELKSEMKAKAKA